MITILMRIQADTLYDALKLLDKASVEVEEYGNRSVELSNSIIRGDSTVKIVRNDRPTDVVSTDIIIYRNSYNELPLKDRIRGLPYIIDDDRDKNFQPIRRG